MQTNILQLKTSPGSHGEEQKVGWLELFYDLVYVATVIALGNQLSDDISTDGVLTFAVLFVPIWWSWAGLAFYITRFSLDDVGHRLLVFAQMFAVSVLAIHAHDGLGDNSAIFAVAYAGARMLLVLMYVRAGQQYPTERALTTRYARGFSLAAAIWFISALVPTPLRFGLWVAGLIVDFGTPLLPSTRQLQAQSPPSAHHLPERFGLFTIIVLGEAFIKVITGATGHELELSNAFYGVCALIIAASIWWMYFDNVKGSVVRRTLFAGQVWVYTHLPLVAAITVFGVAAKKVVLLEPHHDLPDEKRLLMAGAVAVTLLTIAILDLASVSESRDKWQPRLILARLSGAVIAIGLGLAGSSLSAGVLMVLLAAICAAQILLDIYRYLPQVAETQST